MGFVVKAHSKSTPVIPAREVRVSKSEQDIAVSEEWLRSRWGQWMAHRSREDHPGGTARRAREGHEHSLRVAKDTAEAMKSWRRKHGQHTNQKGLTEQEKSTLADCPSDKAQTTPAREVSASKSDQEIAVNAELLRSRCGQWMTQKVGNTKHDHTTSRSKEGNEHSLQVSMDTAGMRKSWRQQQARQQASPRKHSHRDDNTEHVHLGLAQPSAEVHASKSDHHTKPDIDVHTSKSHHAKPEVHASESHHAKPAIEVHASKSDHTQHEVHASKSYHTKPEVHAAKSDHTKHEVHASKSDHTKAEVHASDNVHVKPAIECHASKSDHTKHGIEVRVGGRASKSDHTQSDIGVRASKCQADQTKHVVDVNTAANDMEVDGSPLLAMTGHLGEDNRQVYRAVTRLDVILGDAILDGQGSNNIPDVKTDHFKGDINDICFTKYNPYEYNWIFGDWRQFVPTK